ncbi:major facilitator superfamily domain-containing protein 12-like [Macadamia integrifolia]|uniref:major facilitator superfamily domain-containing protein 12-like n=1 Tax=Macadamia integrifolia TaxID=60698 RepID=UPI001C4ECE5D|nr:major facilitator superfamily domain-containing protein 12-like [Macadamia integrifolia]
MVNSSEDEESCSKPLGRVSVVYYGVGHMLNDITSARWFTYLLVFLTDIGLSPRDAAIVMLSGQVADGFTTIFAGELIDRFGHFKIWHGAGSVLVTISFSFVFGGCLPCRIFERNWSAWDTVQTKKRNRLALEMLEDLVYIRMNSMMRENYESQLHKDSRPIDLDNLGDLPIVDFELEMERLKQTYEEPEPSDIGADGGSTSCSLMSPH